MHQPLERQGPAERGANEQEARREEAGPSSGSHSRKCSLIQDQARELTRLRQKVRLGGAVSSLLIQHVKNTVKNFEELLGSSKLDRSVEQHFREQLASGRELAESLASKFGTDDYANKKNQRGQMLQTLSILRKMNKMGGGTDVLETRQDAPPWTLFQIHSSSHAEWTAHCYPGCASPPPEEQEVRPVVNVADDSLATPTDPASSPGSHSAARSAQPCYTPSGTEQLSRTPDPGHHGCSSPGDEMRPQKMNALGHLSSAFSFYWPSSTSSGADLLEKNLVEIQNLRQRLEDSVCTNDRLQERLEHALSNLDQGKDSGSISSTTSFSAAVSLPISSGPRTETSALETNRHLRSQLEESKQNFGDITVKFLSCKATAHSLAKQLRKYKCEECEDLAASVLKEDTPFEEGDLAEKAGTAAWLGYDYLIQAQARELAHLRRQIQEGKGICYLFTRHVKTTAKSFESLLGATDIAYYQGQRFCEQLAQGSRLAESLASKLGLENQNDKKDEDGQKAMAPRRSRGLQKEEANEVLEDSLDERYLTHSGSHDSPQPPSSDAFLCDVQKASSAVAVAKGEVQNLHQHLEEILFVNGCLGDKLERHLSIADKGSSTGGPGCTSNLYREILESAVQLHDENRDTGKEIGASRLT